MIDKKLYRILLLFVVAITHIDGGFLGCFKDHGRRNLYNVNPGAIGPGELEPGRCRTLCGGLGYQYAALTGETNAMKCRCGHIPPIPHLVQDVGNTLCGEPCETGTETCGSKTHSVVYDALPSMKLSVTISATIVPTGAAVTYNPSVTTDAISYMLAADFDDSAGQTDFQLSGAGLTTRSFYAAGIYDAVYKLTSSDLVYPIVEAGRRVKVVSPPQFFTLSCPTDMATHTESTCNGTVLRGTSMTLVLSYTDGTPVTKSFAIADAAEYQFGNPVQMNPGTPPGSANAATGGLVLLQASQAQYEGNLVAIQYYARAAGSLTVYIYRPACVNNDFCYATNNCTATCAPACGGGLYCSDVQDCCDGPLIRSTGLQTSYSLIYSSPATAVTAGHGVMDVTGTGPAIMRGDIVGYELTAADVLSVRAATTPDDDYFCTGLTGPTTVDAVSCVPTSENVMLEAIYATPSKMVLPFTFLYTETARNISAVVKSRHLSITGTAGDWASVNVLEGVDQCIILMPACIQANLLHTMRVAPFTGTLATVAWTFGDGGNATGVATNDVTYSYAVADTYTISVVIANALTSKSNTTTICVEELITDLSLWLLPGQMVLELGVTSFLTLSMTSGSHYTCSFGVTYPGYPREEQTLTYAQYPPSSSIQKMFVREGVVNLDIACSNNIGSMSWTKQAVVVERLTGVTLSPTGAWPNVIYKYVANWETGSDVTINMTVDGVAMPLTVDAANKQAFSADQPGETLGTSHAVVIVASNLLNSVSLSQTFMVDFPCDLVDVTIFSPTEITNTGALAGTTVIPMGANIEVSIAMTMGTGVNILITWGDGSADYPFSAPASVDWNDPTGSPTLPIVHTYSSLLECNLVVTVWNNANSETKTFPIITVVDLTGIVLNNLTGPQYNTPPAVHNFDWTVPVGVGVIPNVSGEIRWGDDNYDTWSDGSLDLNAPLTHEYLDKSGHLLLTWTIWNYFTSVSGSFYVDVVNPLVNCTLSTSSAAGIPNTPIDLVFMAYRAPGPGDCTLEWDCGDGVKVSTVRTGQSPFGTDTHSCTYTAIGTHLASVKITTPLDTETHQKSVVIMNPPVASLTTISTNMPMDFEIVAPGPCDATFQVFHDPTLPDASTTIKFDFGDGNSAGPLVFSSGITQLHSYTTHGAYVTTITLQNDAATVIREIESGCYADFAAPTTAQISRIPSLPVGSTAVVGYGLSENEFVISEDLFITPSFTRGTNQWWEITAVSPGNIFTCNSTTFTGIPFGITATGTYTINIQAKNYFYESPMFTDTIYMYERPGVMAFDDGDTVTGPGDPKSIDVVMDRYGTNQCIACLDGENTYVHLYGNSAKCSPVTSVPIWPNRNVVYDITVDVSVPFTLTYTYTRASDFLLQCYAWNDYGSSVSPDTFPFPVSNIQCARPYPYIETPFEDFRNPQQFVRSKVIEKEGKVDIDCMQTLANRKKWTMIRWDAANNVPLYEVILESYTAYNAKLSLAARTLPLGLYQAKYRVQMNAAGTSDADFAGDSFTFFEVVQSPLVVQIFPFGVTDISVGKDDTFAISPATYSYDPDVATGEEDLFDLFEMSCIDVTNGESHQSNSVFVTPLALDAPPPSVFSGCWGSGPGWISGFSGDATYNASQMQPGINYEFKLIGYKDTRSSTFYARVNVSRGTIPKASISFIQGQITTIEQEGKGVLFNPSSSLGLKVSLDEACSDCDFKWELFMFDYDFWGAPYYLWHPLVYLPYYIQGIYSSELGIDPYVWEHYSTFDRFKIQCTIHSSGTYSSDNVISVEIFRNTPPYNGTCNISPLNGQSLVTKHNVTCSGFIDDDHEIKDYSLYCGGKIVGTTEVPEFLDLVLTSGDPANGYQLSCEVHVRDELGSIGKFSLPNITSTALSMADLRTELSNLSLTLGMVNAKANLRDVTTYMSALGQALEDLSNNDEETDFRGRGIYESFRRTGFSNNDRYSAFTAENPDEAEVEVYENNREMCNNVVEQLADTLAATTLYSMSDITAALGSMAGIATGQAFLNIGAQGKMLSVLNKGISGLTRSQEETSPEDAMKVASDLTTICQNLQEATVLNVNIPSKGDVQRQEGPVKTFPTNLDSKAKDVFFDPLNMSPEDAKRLGMLSLNSRDQSEFAETLEAQCTRLKNTAYGTLSKIKAASEVPMEIQGSHVESKIFTTTASNLKGKAMTSAAGELSLPSLIPGLDENEKYTFTFEGATSCGQVTTDDVTSPADTCSRCISASFQSSDGSETKISNLPGFITIEIDRDPNCRRENDSALPLVDPQVPREIDHGIVRTVDVAKENSAISISFLNVTNSSIWNQMLVLVDFDKVPGLPNPKWSCLIPHNTLERDQSCSSSNEVDPWTCHVPGDIVSNQVGTWKVRIIPLNENEVNVYTSLAKLPSQLHWGGKQFSMDFALKLVEVACPYTESGSSVMKTAGCYPQPSCSGSKVRCKCNHLTSFAGGWVVAPNTIDWAFVFSNADFFKNPTLYITEIVIVITYIMAMIWARRKDRQDLTMLGLAPLLDNDPRDKYYYEIMVNTGMRRNAGTESKVHFILSGEEDETDVRTFTDKKRKIFQRGQTDGFLMAVESPLGALSYLRIWHDNSGKGKTASWYLNHVIIRDIQTDRKYYFIANKWFAVEEDDGQVDRVIPVAGKEQMTEFSYMFSEQATKNLSDGHLWFSVVARPPQSRFTRCQRVSCCLCLLFMSMLANAMFYGTEDSDNTAYQFGPFALTPEQIFIGIAANLIIFPVNFLIITLFRKSRPRKLRPSRVEEALKSMPERTTSMTDVNMRVKSSMSTERPGSSFLIDAKRSDSAMNRPDSVLSAETNAAMAQTKKKKKCTLPWWFVVVAWILLWLAVLVSAAFVTFYGIMFQDIKCKKWITSMLVSFFTSIFFTQPIKVFLFAIIFSLIIKNPGGDEEEEEDEEPTKKLDTDEELLHKEEDGYGLTAPMRPTYKPKPPDAKSLEAARQQRMKEIKMWSVIREILFYAFFLWILLVISYKSVSSNSYHYKYNMEKVFIITKNKSHSFTQVKNVESYWTWAQTHMLRGLRAGPYYNDFPAFNMRGYINDKVSRLMGYAVLRQLRVKPGSCKIPPQVEQVIDECNADYSYSVEQKDNFGPGWSPTVNSSREEYIYQSAESLNGYPHWGEMAMYSGGGYVVRLNKDWADMVTQLKQLEREKWIDEYTRVVFLEFTVYNPSINMFAISNLVAEFRPSGGVFPAYRFEPATLLPYMSSVLLFQIVCEIVYFLFTCYFVIKEIRAFYQQRMEYFKQFWNIVELCICAMSVTAIVIYFYRLVCINELTEYFEATQGNGYMKFQYVGYWSEIFSYIIGFLVYFACLKFLKLLRFNKKVSLLADVLKNSAKDLIHFSIIFNIVFLAFIQVFYLIYVARIDTFKTFMSSCEAGIVMMMGKFDIYNMLEVNQWLTQIFLFLFVVTITFIIVNMFLSILNDTFGAVRNNMAKQNNDYEIVEFMMSRFKLWTGLGRGDSTMSPADLEKQRRKNCNTLEGQIDYFPDQIDRFLASISNMYMEKSKFDDFLHQGAVGKMAAKAQKFGAGSSAMLPGASAMHPAPKPGATRLSAGASGMTDVHTD